MLDSKHTTVNYISIPIVHFPLHSFKYQGNRVKISYVLAISLFTLSSCISVTPTFDEALMKHVEALNNDIDKIDSAVSAVYEDKTPFSKVEGIYVDAVSNVRSAIYIAEGRATYLRNRVSGRPAQIIHKALLICQEALMTQLAAHRKAPFNVETASTFATKEACSVPKLFEARLK